jgi:ATP-binding cassette subfamily B protein
VSPEGARLAGYRSLAATLLGAAPSRHLFNTVCSVIASAAWPLGAVGVALLTDGIVDHHLRTAVGGGLLTAASAVLADGLTWTSMALHFSLVERVGRVVDEQLMAFVAGAPGIEIYERPEVQDRVQLLRDQRDELANLPDSVVDALSVAVRAALTLALLVAVNPVLLALPLFALPTVVATRAGSRRQTRAQDASASGKRLANALFDLAIQPGPADEVRIFRLGPALVSRHGAIWRELDAELRAADRRGAIYAAAAWAVFAVGFVGAIALVVLRAVHREASPGEVVLTLSLAAQLNGELGAAVSMAHWLQASLRAAQRYLWLAAYSRTATAAVAPVAERALPDLLCQGIELRNVSFAYPGTDDVVLDDVSVVLPAGATVALVGDNGAGKTTLVKLLCRLYEPSSGSVRVDDVPVTSFTPEAWRSRVSAAFQDFARFELLAGEAVGVGQVAEVTDERKVRAAVSSAGADDLVEGLPRGLSTQLGRSFAGGVELSGGQWQKVALARALMRDDPLLLVFDEPTAALDALSEHALFERFTEASRRVANVRGAVTVLVSHRFSTVRMADLILVLSRGRLVEAGSHLELMAARGLYAELYALQAGGYR